MVKAGIVSSSIIRFVKLIKQCVCLSRYILSFTFVSLLLRWIKLFCCRRFREKPSDIWNPAGSYFPQNLLLEKLLLNQHFSHKNTKKKERSLILSWLHYSDGVWKWALWKHRRTELLHVQKCDVGRGKEPHESHQKEPSVSSTGEGSSEALYTEIRLFQNQNRSEEKGEFQF